MLTAALWFGMVWPHVVPLAVQPGMPSEQARALLGKRSSFAFSGAVSSPSICEHYADAGITLFHQDGRVETVLRKKR